MQKHLHKQGILLITIATKFSNKKIKNFTKVKKRPIKKTKIDEYGDKKKANIFKEY